MNGESKPIPSDAAVFRAISEERWIKGNIVSPKAFLLRPARGERKAETELSMLTEANCTKEVCYAPLIKKCSGELLIKAALIRELELEIIDDSEKLGIPFHASILNLPQHEGETLAKAEFLAGELAKRVIQIKERPKN